MAHVHECATCGRLTEGAATYRSDAPRDPWGRIERAYADSNPPTFCSQACRDAEPADELELEESGQYRLGTDGEQRSLEGLAAPVEPAPLNHEPEHPVEELEPAPKRSSSKRRYSCAYCGRELKPDAWIYSRATGSRFCPPTDPAGCNTPKAYAKQERARARARKEAA